MNEELKFSEQELTDLYQGLVIAMKVLDNGNLADSRLADRLEEISKKLDDYRMYVI